MTAQTWTTIADLATALGTLVLAVATFSAIRSANLSARRSEIREVPPPAAASH